MDPKQELIGRYLDLCAAFRDGPEVVPQLEGLRAEAASRGLGQWECFLEGRIAFVCGEYSAALERFERALAEEPGFPLAVHMQGVCLGSLGRHEEALAACQRAIAVFTPQDDPALQGHLAKAMVNRGATLGELGRHDESIAACREVAARFGDAADPALREQAAKAMINLGVSFGELGRHEDELATYEEVISRFGDSREPPLQAQVAWAMVNCGIALGELGRGEDELAAYDDVISRFGDAEDPDLCQAVAEASFNREVVLGGDAGEDDAMDTSGPAELVEQPRDESSGDAPCSAEDLVERIHAAPGRLVLVVSGGGSQAIGELLQVPGASRTLLEAVVPYCDEALTAWLGGRPDEACSARTVRAMAMVAFHRARRYEGGEDGGALPAGVACTAALATDRPRRGTHRAHLALQTARLTATWSLELQKGGRTRAEEEQLVCRLLINTLAEACGVSQRLQLDLLDGEQVMRSQTVAPQPWRDLLLGRIETVGRGQGPVRAVLSGAFNPLHAGHLGMAEIARQILEVPVVMELSIVNADKPPLDYQEIQRRLGQFGQQQGVCLTRAATFEEKSRLFPGATFLVGVDTLRRIADSRFYGDDPAACLAAVRRIAGRGCRFLVFGRDLGTGFVRFGDLDLPEPLRGICQEVPAAKFREDVSSTQLRGSGGW